MCQVLRPRYRPQFQLPGSSASGIYLSFNCVDPQLSWVQTIHDVSHAFQFKPWFICHVQFEPLSMCPMIVWVETLIMRYCFCEFEPWFIFMCHVFFWVWALIHSCHVRWSLSLDLCDMCVFLNSFMCHVLWSLSLDSCVFQFETWEGTWLAAGFLGSRLHSFDSHW